MRLILTIRLPVGLHEWFKEYANKERLSVNLAIVLLIQKKFPTEKRIEKKRYNADKNEINAHRPHPTIIRALTIRLPADLHGRVKEYADEIGVSMNKAIVFLMKKRHYAEKQKKRLAILHNPSKR